MYEQYLADASSVSESWQEFFADYKRDVDVAPSTNGEKGQKPARATAPARPEEPAESESSASADSAREAKLATNPEGSRRPQERGEPIRGVGARIVENMERSLGVPTATSYRNVPAKLLEVNRSVINGYLGRTRGGKVSFTHLIGFAVVRAIADSVPAMNNAYVEGADGKPRIIRNEHVGLGIAVDLEKADGSRSLVVPVVKNADTLDFRGFWGSYEELIRKVRNNKLTPDDFAGATVSLTNPGTIGTVQSVPRLMPGQGLIVGVGSIEFPAEMQAADPETLADLGMSKIITISSTYDHRIIQGAESGLFLKRVHELLLGEEGFYDEVFRSLGVPYEAVQWRQDVRPVDQVTHRLEKQMAVQRLINMYRVRGHLMADLDPLRWREPKMHTELDPLTYGLTIWDLDREYLTGGLAGEDKLTLRHILKVLRDAYCRTLGIEYMHIQDPEQKAWIQEQVEGVAVELQADEQQHVLGRLNAAEAFEKFLATKYIGQKRFGLEGGESAIVILDAVLEQAAGRAWTRPSSAWRTGAGSTSSSTSWARISTGCSREFEGYVTRGLGPGQRRRQVPPRPGGHLRVAPRRIDRRRARRQPQPPRGRRPRRHRHGPGPAGPDRPARGLLGAARPHPRRRRVRRTGRRRRDAADVRHPRLPRRRHGARHRQQPDRLHHHARREPLGVLHVPTWPR